MKAVESIACIASHSALDVFDGAKDYGFSTVALCRRGRERIYRAACGAVDKCIVMESYADVIKPEVQGLLKEDNAVIVPNRSMAVYVGYDNIETRLNIPVFGNKRLLRWEERRGGKSYYKLLDKAGIRRPALMKLEEVDRPVILKVQEAARPQERAFIIAKDGKDLENKIGEMLKHGLISERMLENAVAEELILGAHFNINYFYSVVRDRLEIVSVDRRIQSNLDGWLRLPAAHQLGLEMGVSMIEVGHIPATLRESLLEEAYDMGVRFVEASRELEPPGVIGPFTLQTLVTPELRLVVHDVATRIGGGTNAQMSIGGQYSKLFLRKPLSMGGRICLEVREALENNILNKITT